MTARAGAPPGERRGPVVTPAPSRIEVATTDTAAVMVNDRSGKTGEPSCWLCPLPRCGYPGCRVDEDGGRRG